MRYFFHIGYNGIAYNGWQKLPQANSIQQIIETTLSKLLKKNITIVGCGRTDAKVHATQFFFHVDIEMPWEFDMLFRINKNLPPDIAVFDVIAMDGLQHARFDAIKRTYDYFIHTYKDPFLNNVSAPYQEKNLNIFKMKEAVSLLTQYDDYRAFCRNFTNHRTTICKISSASLYVDSLGDRLRFNISANRFLSGMIRIIVQRLLHVGTHKLTVDEFEQFLISKEPPKMNEPAYPQGLFLSKVTYPFLDLPPRAAFSNIPVNESTQWQLVE
ncbi:tRNA pseudouridine synthase A [Chryseosolibacter indicus]|uniref:tRNA pseudouridine synthase A n=1 Tax=Chryseosolibacter indicus TaxID=2782351 RepID=A0ABS5VSU0_9BACT|nr:tRNA pseudouridine synthase A [Chryseosolibacter indicus]MBT1704503.1 tRNA pseudouridine(38-40) synthase TruA [Chryseosolibacter indicus]